MNLYCSQRKHLLEIRGYFFITSQGNLGSGSSQLCNPILLARSSYHSTRELNFHMQTRPLMNNVLRFGITL
uniref:Uncharacterized protein n=1 Tax=Lepeophtheirus salmonis TaxID=72036 RepID=A0A0K2UZ63_LEPSM